MFLTDWLHTFTETTPDNRTNLAKKSGILYSDTMHEYNTTLPRRVEIAHNITIQ